MTATAPRAARAGAAAALRRRRDMSGVVCGQDTPVKSAADLPDNIKDQFSSVVEHNVPDEPQARQWRRGQEGGGGGGGGRPFGLQHRSAAPTEL